MPSESLTKKYYCHLSHYLQLSHYLETESLSETEPLPTESRKTEPLSSVQHEVNMPDKESFNEDVKIVEEPQILLDDDGKEIKLNNVNTSELEIEKIRKNMFDDLNVFNTNELKLKQI